MSVFLLFVSFGIVYLVQFFVKKILLWSKLPPGPWGVPFLGSVPFLGGGPLHLKLDSLRKKHGDVFTVGVFHKEVVVLSDWESIRDFFGRLDFSGRPDALLFRQVALGNNGIVSSQGSLWQENRRFTLRVLRDFGFGKREALDSMIQDAALGLCRSLRARRHEPQDFGPHLNLAVLNVIWKMTADKQFAHDDPRMQDFMDRVLEVLNDSSLLGPIQWVPAFVYLWPPALKAYRRVNRNMAAISQIFLNEVEEHKRNLPSSGGSKDYIDAYLTEMALQKSRGEVNPNFTEFQLRVNISDLFIAGSESTATAIRWSVLFLLCHPDVQEKLQAEVDSVVGHDRLPSLHDRNRMPYTEAFIMEVQRASTLGPLGVSHTATADVDFGGYRFPKGTMFMPNIWSCHMDPKFWPDPERFDPGRFLNPDGSLKAKVPSYLPFALGKRECLGASLARMELFSFVAILVQKFAFLPPPGRPRPRAEGVGGIFLNLPKPYRFVVKERSR